MLLARNGYLVVCLTAAASERWHHFYPGKA